MSKVWQGNGIITLTTDFGVQDPFVGVMKGAILSRYPSTTIVDLTHAVQPYWPVEAGFWLSRSFSYFPAGTVHVAVVDPGVGTARKILIIEAMGHCFLAPDNGLLASLLRRHAGARMHALEPAYLDRFNLPIASATFHGRDIFAPIAAELAHGRCRPGELGDEVTQILADPKWEPTVSPEEIAGMVITVDRFGNLITNIEGQFLNQFARPALQAGGRKFRFARTYAEGRLGECLALVNAFGVIEIAQVQGDASLELGLRRGAEVILNSEL